MREVTYWVLPTSRTSQEAAPGTRISLQGIRKQAERSFPNALVEYMRVSSDNDRQTTDLQRELHGSMLGRDTG